MIRALGDIAEVQMGYFFRSRLEHDPKGDALVVQMKDIDETNLLQLDGAARVVLPRGKERHLLREGDLLFRSRGRSTTAALIPPRMPPAVLSAPMLLVRPTRVLPAYLQWFINSRVAQRALAGMAKGTLVAMISAKELRLLEVPIPSPDQQRNIAEIARLAQREQTLMAEIATKKEKLVEAVLMRRAKNTR